MELSAWTIMQRAVSLKKPHHQEYMSDTSAAFQAYFLFSREKTADWEFQSRTFWMS
jgi:hypothetical protein